jgi:phosphotransferase system enzyme I (PtsI)
VLELIRTVIDNGHKNNIEVGLCGEMAGDIFLTMILLGMGLDEFSMSPIAVPEVRKIVRSISFREAQAIAKEAMTFNTGKEIQEFARSKLEELVPDIATELA